MSVCLYAVHCVCRDRLSTALDALRALKQRILRANHRTVSLCVIVYAVFMHLNGHIYAHDAVANRYFRAQKQQQHEQHIAKDGVVCTRIELNSHVLYVRVCGNL